MQSNFLYSWLTHRKHKRKRTTLYWSGW